MSQRVAVPLIVVIALASTIASAWCFWGFSPQPRSPLEIVPAAVNLGQIWLHEDKPFEVELRNPGSEVVEIGKLRLDCACANVKLAAFRLEPGGTTRLTGVLQGRDTPGGFARRLLLTIEKPKRLRYTLPITGEARRRIDFSPQALVLRPSFPEGKAGTATLTVRNASDEEVEVTLPTDLPAGISVSIDQAALAPAASCRVTVGADPSRVIATETELTLGCSHSLEKTIKVPIEVRPVEGVSVSPERIAFGVLPKERLLERQSVALKLQGGLVDHCDIAGVTCPQYMKLGASQPGTPSGWQVVLVLQDEFERADLGGMISIRLRDKRSESVFEVEAKVSGFLTDAARHRSGG